MTTSSIASSTSSTTTSTVSTDVYNRVQTTMAAQNAGATKLNTALTTDQTKLSALGQLQSALSDFQSLAASLTGSGLSTSAKASDSSVLSASSTGTASAGTYAVDVQQLAQGQFLTSESFASSTSTIGTGAQATIQVDFGTAGADGFVTNGTSTSKTITIDSSNNTLAGIAAAFKTAGINASVVKGSDGQYALNITGANGATQSMRISVSGDAALKSAIGYDPDSTQDQGLSQTAAAQDAIVTVDGKQVTSSSNTLDKAITGATLTLTATGKTDVTISQDASQIGTNLTSFVNAYNTLNSKLQSLQAGDLKSDTAVNQVVSQMSLLLKTGGNGAFSLSALSAAGVTTDSSGNLQIDSAKLQTALTTDSSAVAKLFTNDGKGMADMLSAKASAFTATTSVIGKETTATTNEIASITKKRAALTEALTAQATALAALYTAQAETASGSAVNGSSSGSLFDMLG